MRILVVNDDGPRSEGLHALINVLKDEHKLTVVIPREEHSGTAHSISFFTPLIAEEITLEDFDRKVWMINGTPSDCTIWGHDRFINEGKEPDLIISGINKGFNIAESVYCSGTVGAAMEGYLHGIPAIAVSGSFVDYDYNIAAGIFRRMLEPLLASHPRQRFFYNINFPAVEEADIKGTMMTSIAQTRPIPRLEKRTNPLGQTYYWQTAFMNGLESKPEEGTDLWAVNNGYISITPLKVDMLDRETFASPPDFTNILKNYYE